MKLYYPKDHYDSSHRRHLFPLLKPFLKPEEFTDKERIDIYGVSENDFKFSEDIYDADVAILTMSWWYYKITDKVKIAIDFTMTIKTIYLKKRLAVYFHAWLYCRQRSRKSKHIIAKFGNFT